MKYIVYHIETRSKKWLELTEEDIANTPSDYLIFQNIDELKRYESNIPNHPNTPDASETQKHNNLLEMTSDASENTGDIIEKKLIKTHETERKGKRGGSRVGSGRKPGPQSPLSLAHKQKISQSMKGKKNASKASPL